MAEFVVELKKLKSNYSITPNDIVTCFKNAGFISQEDAERRFKTAVQKVVAWKPSPLQEWCFDQLVGKFPVLKTAAYNDHWRNTTISEATEDAIAARLELMEKRKTQVSRMLENKTNLSQEAQQPQYPSFVPERSASSSSDYIGEQPPQVRRQESVASGSASMPATQDCTSHQQQQTQTEEPDHDHDQYGLWNDLFLGDPATCVEVEDDDDDDDIYEPKSDISAEYHPGRTAQYEIQIIGSSAQEEELPSDQQHIQLKDDSSAMTNNNKAPSSSNNNQQKQKQSSDKTLWKIRGFDMTTSLEKIRLASIQIEPKKLYDTRLLALNNIYLFTDTDSEASVTQFLDVFNNNNNEADNYDEDESHDEDGASDSDIVTNGMLILEHIRARNSFERYKSELTISDKATLWCTRVAQHDKASWSSIQDITIPILVEAKSGGNVVDLVIANILYTQSLKFVGNIRKSKLEDGYVHRITASLLKAIFQSDPLFSYDWANGSLAKRKHDNNNCINASMKPDFIVFVSGEQRDIAVGEIKPPSNSTATNLGESDKLKLGRMMKEIYNDLVARGVTNPVVGGILVEGETMKTFVMRLEFARIYELVEVSRTPIFQSIKTLTSLPTLVSDLMTLKSILRKTATKVMSRTAQKSTADRPTYSPPISSLQFKSYKLNRTKKPKTSVPPAATEPSSSTTTESSPSTSSNKKQKRAK